MKSEITEGFFFFAEYQCAATRGTFFNHLNFGLTAVLQMGSSEDDKLIIHGF